MTGGKNGFAMFGTITPMAPVRPIDSERAIRFGAYPICCATRRMCSRVLSLYEDMRLHYCPSRVQARVPSAPLVGRKDWHG